MGINEILHKFDTQDLFWVAWSVICGGVAGGILIVAAGTWVFPAALFAGASYTSWRSANGHSLD